MKQQFCFAYINITKLLSGIFYFCYYWSFPLRVSSWGWISLDDFQQAGARLGITRHCARRPSWKWRIPCICMSRNSKTPSNIPCTRRWTYGCSPMILCHWKNFSPTFIGRRNVLILTFRKGGFYFFLSFAVVGFKCLGLYENFALHKSVSEGRLAYHCAVLHRRTFLK